MSFRGNFEIIFRAYNYGVAYRFIDNNTNIEAITNKNMELVFPEGSKSFFPKDNSMYSDNESLYIRTSVSHIKKGDFCHLPVMFDIGKNKVLFTEASLRNYPGMFPEKGAGGCVRCFRVTTSSYM
tara:strand:- start:90 stop:464 length:375 start_codon:yes stop_codon:yes gene_type:complete